MSRPRRPAAAQGGYIYVSDEPRHGELIADEASFTAIVASQPRIAARQPAFLTLDREHVDAVARMSQAGPAASFKARVRFDETHQLIGEVSWSDVLDELSPAARAEIEAVLARGGGELAGDSLLDRVGVLAGELVEGEDVRAPHRVEPLRVAVERDCLCLADQLSFGGTCAAESRALVSRLYPSATRFMKRWRRGSPSSSGELGSASFRRCSGGVDCTEVFFGYPTVFLNSRSGSWGATRSSKWARSRGEQQACCQCEQRDREQPLDHWAA